MEQRYCTNSIMLTAQFLLDPYSQLTFPSTEFPHFATSDSYTYFESFTYFPYMQVQVIAAILSSYMYLKSFKVTQPTVSIVKEIPAYNYYTCRCAPMETFLWVKNLQASHQNHFHWVHIPHLSALSGLMQTRGMDEMFIAG